MQNEPIETNIEEQATVPEKSSGSRSEITEDNCKLTEGEELRLVRVRFPGHAKSYPFLIGKRSLMYGQKVMAMSDRGLAMGYINSFAYKAPFKKNMLPLRYINKVATDEDIAKELEIYKKQKHAETICHGLIQKHKLDMNLTHVEFTGFGKKVVFYFTAPARVDFRGLVRDLVQDLKLRIELRQISLRDRAASMGALGPCGRELCCSSFLSKYGNVSIKMAKNQNLTLNYSKLNGACGQLKCCLQYEDEVYAQKRKFLPEEGAFIETKNGDKGKVFRLNILSEQFDVLTEKGHIKRYVAEQFESYLGANFKMPHRFDNISDQTATIIGLNELENKVRDFKENEEVVLYNQAIDYAHDQFTLHSETETIRKEHNPKFDADLESVEPKIIKRQARDANQESQRPQNKSRNERGQNNRKPQSKKSFSQKKKATDSPKGTGEK